MFDHFRLKYGEILKAAGESSETKKKGPHVGINEGAQLILILALIFTYIVMQVVLTETDLLECSRFMDETSNLSLLASKLGIPDDEVKSSLSRHKKPQGQAHNILQAWYSRTQSQNERRDLVAALNATNCTAAAKWLVNTNNF